MPRALVVQHVAAEGPGRFAEWLPQFGLDLDVVHPYAGDWLPATVGHDALIVMGGPMGANDDEGVPWLSATKALLKDAIDRAVPTLGICLGAQLLAVAAGGKVDRGEAGPEIGLGEVTGAGRDRVLISGHFPVVQWHYDTVIALPEGAALLASSEQYPVQAFRVGEAAWGLQFHVEASPELVRQWAQTDGYDVSDIVDPIAEADLVLASVGEQIARRFVAFVAR